MKKIVPFNNILNFNTDINEITAISLEHKINSNTDSISGEFIITGEYKINEGDIKKEPFNYTLPFDIALGCSYKEDTLLIDIDDFRYELIDKNKVKVNIDLYIDGEEIERNILEDKDIEIPIKKEVIETKEEEITIEPNINNIENNNENINIFNGYNEDNEYVTYKIYNVKEGDTIDSILKKYNITKEELSNYNIIDNIKTNDKLIIPSNDK